MFLFGFALVPLYDVFCDVTGLNGKTGGKVELSQNQRVDESRELHIAFVTSLNEQMPWTFKPMTLSTTVHPGEQTKVDFYVKNLTDKTIVGQAVPSVVPGLAAQYFQKTECFCFTEQTLKAGEEKRMPVVFVVDPAIPEYVKQLTLSYTFFIKPESEAAPLALNKITNKENQEL